MKYALLLSPLALAACAAPPPQIVTKEVKIAVPVPCHVEIGPEPDYPDTDAALARVPHPQAAARLLADPGDRKAWSAMGENMLYLMKLYRAGRAMRIARDARKTAALDACAAPD